jgi:hypothetical protein
MARIFKTVFYNVAIIERYGHRLKGLCPSISPFSKIFNEGNEKNHIILSFYCKRKINLGKNEIQSVCHKVIPPM